MSLVEDGAAARCDGFSSNTQTREVFMVLETALAALGLIAAAAAVFNGVWKQIKGTTDPVKDEGKTWVKMGVAVASMIFGLWLLRFCYDVVDEQDEMSAAAYQIIRLTIGLASGFIATGLAGPFQIDTKWQDVTVKAGGPIGVAIFFYLVNPISIGTFGS